MFATQNNCVMRSTIYIIVFFQFVLSFNGYAQGVYMAQNYISKLSHPEMHGRGYIDSGDYIAANYIKSQFERLGLKPITDKYIQHFTLDVNTIQKSEIILDGAKMIAGIQYIVSPSSPSISGSYDLKFISYKQLQKKNIIKKMQQWYKKGCITVLPEDHQNEENYQKALAMLRASGEVPIFIRPNKSLIYSVGRRQDNYTEITIDPEFLNKKKNKDIEIEIEAVFKPNYQSQNVIGYIPGTENTDSFIIICGHYDHLGKMGDAIYHGANDNASGIAMLLDMAYFFKMNPQKNNLVFIAFGGEEAGLVGSRHFVKKPFVSLQSTKFVLNLDLMGSGENGITVVNSVELEDAYNTLVSLNAKENYLTQVKKRGNTANSDHYPFTQKGVDAFFIYTMGDYTYYHSPLDNADNLQLTSAYTRVFALLYDFIEALNQ
jgi:hypothetical protein